MSQFYNGRTWLRYETATNWETLEIDVLSYEAAQVDKQNVGDMIKFHRTQKGWSQFRLAEELGLTAKQGRYLIKDYETRGLHPPQDLSIKLAEIFNLKTKYFYDPYYDFLDNSTIIITNLRKKYNMNKTKIANTIGVTMETWSRWESGGIVSRENYKKIKGLL